MIKNESRNEVYNSILSRRSIRRFQQKPIKLEILKKMVNTGRLAPSAANLQPLEFFIVNEKNLCDQIFETIGWAGYIKPKWTPAVNERPSAYIVVLVNNEKNPWYLRDVSFATQNIVLFAESLNIGSCILCNINKESIRKILNIPNNIIIDSLIALGYKAEKSVVEDYSGSIEYWRDKNEVLHVPKRKIEDIIHINKFQIF
ncbi:MAG: nitroreductase family protein [Thermoplasmatales archaeon]|nr:MAG: nitroreductase family protein [Thermoplasmatales archaeon]